MPPRRYVGGWGRTLKSVRPQLYFCASRLKPATSPFLPSRRHSACSMVYGVHEVDPLSVDAVMDVANNGQTRSATEIGGSRQQQQDRLVKAKLHSQTVRLREAFLRQDGRITGTIPTYMVPACLKAGGLSLNAQETRDAATEFMTGEGRFNWEFFCNKIEGARAKQWSAASRVKSAKVFAEIDVDGSGQLSREEIEGALKKLNMPMEKSKLDAIVTSCDVDGDGNISYGEFVDGLARDLVSPNSVWSSVTAGANSSRRR